MNRNDFIKVCGLACLGGLGAMTTLLQSCVSGQYFAQNELAGAYLKVAKTEFETPKKNLPERKSVIVKAEELKFPIYLYKISDTEYSALWMECTHQGAELSAHGEVLVCPSHGSEFDYWGKVSNGPAQANLRKFKTMLEDQYILIYLS